MSQESRAITRETRDPRDKIKLFQCYIRELQFIVTVGRGRTAEQCSMLAAMLQIQRCCNQNINTANILTIAENNSTF